MLNFNFSFLYDQKVTRTPLYKDFLTNKVQKMSALLFRNNSLSG
jgi:hypothetical protein